jgi:hypothetical protein
VLQKRPAIGVQLSPTGSARDSIGVFISRVTPNGPAERAGIVEGDRIVSINGVDLKLNSADAGDSYAAELPVRRLTREVGKLTPGAVATLRVWSGGRVRDVPVTVGRASDVREFGLLEGGLRGGMYVPGIEGLRMNLRDLPRMRFEEMRIPRMELDRLRDRIRLEHMAPLHDGRRRKRRRPKRKRAERRTDAAKLDRGRHPQYNDSSWAECKFLVPAHEASVLSIENIFHRQIHRQNSAWHQSADACSDRRYS